METVNVTGETSFNQPFAMLLSWDAETEYNVAALLSKSVFPYSLNFNRFPGVMLKLGVTAGDEDDCTYIFHSFNETLLTSMKLPMCFE